MFLLVLAGLLAVAGYVALLGSNGAGAFFFGGAALSVIVAFADRAMTTFAVLVAIVCGFASWATLKGGANPATAIPWIVVGTASALLAVWLIWRSGRTSDRSSHPHRQN